MKLADIKKEIEAKSSAMTKTKAAYEAKILKLKKDANTAANAATAAAASEDDAAYIKAKSDERAALDLVALYSDKLKNINGGMSDAEIKATAEKIRGAVTTEKAAFYPGILKSINTIYESVDSFIAKIDEANRLWKLVNEINGKEIPVSPLIDANAHYFLRADLKRVADKIGNMK